MTNRTLEERLQGLFGNRTRFNEIDPRFLTRDAKTPKGLLKLPYRALRVLAYESGFSLWRRAAGDAVQARRPILMYGVPHSGTSITERVLASHPAVADFSEANTILQPHGYFDIQNGGRVRTAAEATESERRRLHARFEFHRRMHRTERILNKSPNNTVRLDFLSAVFPDADFVHVIRDGRAVVSSLVYGRSHDETVDQQKPWRERANPFAGVRPANWQTLLRDDLIEQNALQWREVVRHALQMEKSLGLRVLHVRYEDLVTSLDSTLANMCRFCGLDPALIRHHEPVHDRREQWRTRLRPEQIRTIEDVAGDLLTELGYMSKPSG